MTKLLCFVGWLVSPAFALLTSVAAIQGISITAVIVFGDGEKSATLAGFAILQLAVKVGLAWLAFKLVGFTWRRLRSVSKSAAEHP
jgi:hypothetical protein